MYHAVKISAGFNVKVSATELALKTIRVYTHRSVLERRAPTEPPPRAPGPPRSPPPSSESEKPHLVSAASGSATDTSAKLLECKTIFIY